jgi:glycosyltransferase involved in cell wall biosynthesis
LFHPRDRSECRRELGLPDGAMLVGTAGALSQTRGIKALFEAFDAMSRRDARLRLVLAGPLDGTVSLPVGDRVHYLGMLPATAVPTLLGALDVSVVCNRDSSFGRYCFPQKLYESLACGIPTVVARVGAMASLLQDHPRLLFEPDDPASLGAAIASQLADPGLPGLPIPDWQAMGERLLEVIRETLSR